MTDQAGRVLDGLKHIEGQLKIVHAGVVVAAAALRHQHAEQDEEIARVLRYCVGERLFLQIEQVAGLARTLRSEETAPRREAASPGGHEIAEPARAGPPRRPRAGLRALLRRPR